MKSWLQAFWALAVSSHLVLANEVKLTQDERNMQQCAGMYSKKAWGGSVDPFILTKFSKPKDVKDDPLVSIVIYESRDRDLIGVWQSEGALDKIYQCDDDAVKASICKEDQIGEFVLSPNVTETSRNQIITQKIHLNDPKSVKYQVEKTGYYCVDTLKFSDVDYEAVVEFRNAYGELPAAQIAKLPFYGGLTIVYAVIGMLVHLQRTSLVVADEDLDFGPSYMCKIDVTYNYITAILVFLIVEQLMTWGFYGRYSLSLCGAAVLTAVTRIDYSNSHGNNAIAKIMMIIVAVLNAGRNSFSFFLLLIVCMGYGVVKPSLGKTMTYVRFLALAHFVFGVIYAVASLNITPENAGPLVLLVILPLAATLTAFYVWTLNSLNMTMKDLLGRKQNVKAMMYRKLWYCIIASILVIFAFFFFNSFTFAGRGDPDFVPDHWKTRWFILDGWLNLVYLVDIAYVAYLWRPTVNNRRFAMSDELAQDDEGFEVASFGGSLDEEEGGSPENLDSRGNAPLSPVPPKPINDNHNARQSLDGETIFAVGEDGDKWSDDEESPRNSTERTRLNHKND